MLKRLKTLAAAICLLIPAARALAQHDAPHNTAAVANKAETLAPQSASGSHDAAAAESHGEHGALPLLPDPSDKATWIEALWTVIIFLVLLAVLYPTAWKQVLAGLKAREERIRGDIAEAEAVRAKAEATLKDYNAQLASAEARIRDLLSKATADGEKLATNIRMQAQTEAEEIKERAQKDIDAAKNTAIGEIYSQAADLSTSIAEKILRRNLNADDQRDLVRQSLEQLQTVKN